ncbi:MAG: hypothetical protein Ct9H300mP11_22490 [Chloroflexota bacterium]|nr:MAG: hypothetical protein Ct9H300mP11_22490 [Chloroflexota bacterium]
MPGSSSKVITAKLKGVILLQESYGAVIHHTIVVNLAFTAHLLPFQISADLHCVRAATGGLYSRLQDCNSGFQAAGVGGIPEWFF